MKLLILSFVLMHGSLIAGECPDMSGEYLCPASDSQALPDAVEDYLLRIDFDPATNQYVYNNFFDPGHGKDLEFFESSLINADEALYIEGDEGFYSKSRCQDDALIVELGKPFMGHKFRVFSHSEQRLIEDGSYAIFAPGFNEPIKVCKKLT